MSFIITYKCSNTDCLLHVRLRERFPIWKESTPEDNRMVPVSDESLIDGYYSERACISCKKIVEVSNSAVICPECGSNNSFLELDKACHLCKKGVVIKDIKKTVSF